jgi:hypothetical protein
MASPDVFIRELRGRRLGGSGLPTTPIQMGAGISRQRASLS